MIEPSISDNGIKITLQNNLLSRLFRLYLFLEEVTIDRRRRLIVFQTRRFYFWHTLHLVRFDQISHVDYDFSDIKIGWLNWLHLLNPLAVGGVDDLEWYSLSIVLKTNGKFSIAHFVGDAAISEVVSTSNRHDQATNSYRLASLLSEVLSVDIGAPASGDAKRPCGHCARKPPKSNTKCIYCGWRAP